MIKRCIFCDVAIPENKGNNPEPLNLNPNAVCCDQCNQFVILARLAVARALNEQAINNRFEI